MTREPAPWSPCKLCDAEDFFRPELVERIRSIGERPRLHAKQWEYAQLLETRFRYAPHAKRLVGLGCGREKTLPVLGVGAEEVIATDLYGRDGAWRTAKTRPDTVYPEMHNLRVHTMDMRAIDLPPRSADFVWAMCALEHVGDPSAMTDVLHSAGELLTDDGVLFVSTEFSLLGGSFTTPGTTFLGQEDLAVLIEGSGLALLAPIELRLSPHPMNAPVSTHVAERHPAIPHVVYRVGRHPWRGALATVVSFALVRGEQRDSVFERDDRFDAVVAELEEKGRKLNQRVSPPWRWWHRSARH